MGHGSLAGPAEFPALDVPVLGRMELTVALADATAGHDILRIDAKTVMMAKTLPLGPEKWSDAMSVSLGVNSGMTSWDGFNKTTSRRMARGTMDLVLHALSLAAPDAPV